MNMRRYGVLSALLVLGFVGCASESRRQNEVNQEKAHNFENRLRIGMTREQLEQELGVTPANCRGSMQTNGVCEVRFYTGYEAPYNPASGYTVYSLAFHENRVTGWSIVDQGKPRP